MVGSGSAEAIRCSLMTPTPTASTQPLPVVVAPTSHAAARKKPNPNPGARSPSASATCHTGHLRLGTHNGDRGSRTADPFTFTNYNAKIETPLPAAAFALRPNPKRARALAPFCLAPQFP